MMRKISELDFLKAAAAAVEEQALENPDIGIPVSPEVAFFMGAFEENAVSLVDLMEAAEPDDEG